MDFPFGSNFASSTSLTTVTGCFGVLAVETFADFCGDRVAAAGDFCGVNAGDFLGEGGFDFTSEEDPGETGGDNLAGDLDGEGSGDISGVLRIRFSSNCCFI